MGFRYFADRAARRVGVKGWVRNLDDGSVEAYAMGTPAQLAEFAGWLWKGPAHADVRGVEEMEAAPEEHPGFRIKR